MASTPMRHARIEDDVMAYARGKDFPEAEEAQLLRAGLYALGASSEQERAACFALAERQSGWPRAATERAGEPSADQG